MSTQNSSSASEEMCIALVNLIWKIVALIKPEQKFDAILICCFFLSLKSNFFFSSYHINWCKMSALTFLFSFPYSRHFVETSQNAQKTTSVITLKSVRDFATLELFSNLNISEVLPHSANDSHSLPFFILRRKESLVL